MLGDWDVLALDGETLEIAEVERVARAQAPVALGARGRERLERSRAALSLALAGEDTLYGVHTGFGSLA